MTDFIVEGLTKSVADKVLFRDMSFIIHPQDRIGLIGLNGTGKSSLLDVLAGVAGFDGDRSPFQTKTDYEIAYLTQEPDFQAGASILETVLSSRPKEMSLLKDYQELMETYEESKQDRLDQLVAQLEAQDVWGLESQAKTILSKLGMEDMQQSVDDLSGGQRRRVQLAQVLLRKADLLLLDEPTNHLDIDMVDWLANYLTSHQSTVCFITHDRYFLDQVSNRIFELDQGRLAEYQGNYQDYVAQKADEEERAASAQHKRHQLYKQELSWMRRQPQARATKQEARIKRFESLKKDMAAYQTKDALEIQFETSRIGKKVLEFKDVSFGYGQKLLFQNFNLLIQNRDRIGIVGDNGVGKSSLLNLIADQLEPTAGELIRGETIKIAYFSQSAEDLDESMRMIEYLSQVASEAKTSSGSVSVSELLEQFLFPRSSHGTVIAKLSGGEKKRLYLLKLLIQQPNVLLLDEPTNDLDIATLTVLETFLQQFAGPILTVSHDRYFLDKVSTKLLAFESGEIREYFGNYTDYLDEKKFRQELVQKQETQSKSSKPRERSQVKRMTYQEQQEWKEIEAKIENLEAAIEEVESQMQENASDYGALAPLQTELEQLNEDLLYQYERYEYLSSFE
ncbi:MULTISPECIES: ABC-F family ATP-binding cassette domain-containing protein [unclassified Streptococcus]|uniref:ABC-F family ATP-binding cassette domain-containing protein n=1 Tax=unclassified Streptococcus TaxID=2608887 RepID=UPI001072B207|nr:MULTISPECIES: ABC-F family ATP-binding cassette domain-containing protein [unclassified Streptococcus]MBF0806060.1 ABC-F family ATP-binding cassette domain-containing protein [Streptococcus sp. 19428wA2_WM07]TFU28356.1 ABC transporter ATP-binding protein [Streptococcus sp. WM07]